MGPECSLELASMVFRKRGQFTASDGIHRADVSSAVPMLKAEETLLGLPQGLGNFLFQYLKFLHIYKAILRLGSNLLICFYHVRSRALTPKVPRGPLVTSKANRLGTVCHGMIGTFTRFHFPAGNCTFVIP